MTSDRSQSASGAASGDRLPPTPDGVKAAGTDAPGAARAADIQQVESDLAQLADKLKLERDEYLELAQRTKADFENYRKRMASEARVAETRGRASLARDVLTVADQLELALEHATEDDGELAAGVKLTLQELQKVLTRAGVESYEPVGEQFDPEWHEALMMQPSTPEQDGKVIDVMAKGYRLDGQVLRAARVSVGKAEAGGQ